MLIYLDIETLRAPEEVRLEILEDVKANFKAPSGLTKTQAAKDMGLDPKSDEVKFTAAADFIKRWESEMAESKSADVAKEKWKNTSFDPNVTPIACICIGWFDSVGDYQSLDFALNDFNHEADMLTEFHESIAGIAGALQFKFVGHNIAKFDLPFIWKRSIVNDVATVKGVKWIDARHEQHCYDTMVAWSGFGNRISADSLSGILGIQGKSDMDGSKVFDTWQEDPKKVIEYCQDDVRMVKEIHARLIK